MNLAYTFEGDKSKIDSCKIKEKSENHWYWTVRIGRFIEKTETVLSTRLPQENYSGIVDLVKNLRPDATDTETAQALVSSGNRKAIFQTIQTNLIYFS